MRYGALAQAGPTVSRFPWGVRGREAAQHILPWPRALWPQTRGAGVLPRASWKGSPQGCLCRSPLGTFLVKTEARGRACYSVGFRAQAWGPLSSPPCRCHLEQVVESKMDGDTAYPVGLFESSRDIASQVLGKIPSA